MTLNQLNDLTEEERDICLYAVSVVAPLDGPIIETLKPIHLTWLKDDVMVQKLIATFPQLLPDAHPIFLSLMKKLGVDGHIQNPPSPPPPPPPALPVVPEQNTEQSGSNSSTGSMSS